MRTRATITALCAALLGSCSPRPETDAETLVIAIQSQVKSFDPSLAMEDDTQRVTTAYTQALVELGYQLEPVPDFAESFSTKDARVYEFRLPHNAKFHDGRPVTCDDVLFSFDWALRDASLLRGVLHDIQKYSCRGPDLFVLELDKPHAAFLGRSVPTVRILPRPHAGQTGIPELPVGTGPFRLVRKHGRDILLERSELYRGPKVGFRRLIARVIEDPTTLYLSLLGGDVDLAFNALAQARVAEALKEPSLKVFRGPSLTFHYMGFNTRIEKFRDPRVRHALALAIPREEIIAHKLLGFAQPASSMLSPTLAAHDPAMKPFAYDLDQARKLLKAAKAEGLSFDVKCSSDRNVVSNLLVIQDAWERIGVHARLKPTEFGTFFADVKKGEFEMFMLRWTAVTDAQIMNEVFHSRELPPGRNRTYYRDAQVDAWLDAASSEPVTAKRDALYRKIEHKLFEQDLPYIPLWHPDNLVVASRRLKDFKIHPSGRWQPAFESHKDPL